MAQSCDSVAGFALVLRQHTANLAIVNGIRQQCLDGRKALSGAGEGNGLPDLNFHALAHNAMQLPAGRR